MFRICSRDIPRHGVVSVGGCQPPFWLSDQAGDNATSDSHQSWDGTPYSTLISGGQATKSVLFYNNARRKIGLVGFWDTVAFDEVGGIKVKDPDTIQIMKDYMANGRFSRGVEVIADASMAFVGNIDQSIEQIVNSTEYDLFLPLPPQFDLAVMDRFACYLPGWEMPKNSSSSLTDRYGLITDYLAEAFHYQLKHSNRYEEVSKRVRLGRAVEGRDEKGIKKTLCAFLKILHPADQPTDAEFEEYVAYAVEVPPARQGADEQAQAGRRVRQDRPVLRQLQRQRGRRLLPESRNATATLEPARSRLSAQAAEAETTRDSRPEAVAAAAVEATPSAAAGPVLTERHYTIQYDDVGHTYDGIFGPYLAGAKAVTIEDPYIRAPHQITNFVRFCETVIKFAPTARRLHLITGYDDKTDLAAVSEKLEELKQSLSELDVFLDIEVKDKLHDREVRMDNGWIIKIGRGLDFYQRPETWFSIGVNDLSLRKCLETKVDIFKVS